MEIFFTALGLGVGVVEISPTVASRSRFGNRRVFAAKFRYDGSVDQRYIDGPITNPNMAAEKHASGAWAHVFAPREKGEARYWLVKSEPDTFSFHDLQKLPKKTTMWDGVRNFVARNFLRDGMQRGDRVFFYHSSTKPQAIVGICEVAKEAYPDPTAFDASHDGFDEKSDRDDPTWYAVDLKAVEPLSRPVTLAELKANGALAGMALLRIGRLSVTPVTPKEWDTILAMSASG